MMSGRWWGISRSSVGGNNLCVRRLETDGTYGGTGYILDGNLDGKLDGKPDGNWMATGWQLDGNWMGTECAVYGDGDTFVIRKHCTE
jgi:hypothetical protein